MSNLYNKLLKSSNVLAASILILVPFWPFLSVWLASWLGNYTLIRLSIELLLLVLVAITLWRLFFDSKLRGVLLRQKWLWLILAIIALEIVRGLIAFLADHISAKALGYAWIVDFRYLLFFVAVFLLASRSDFLRHHWRKIILLPAIAASVFAVLQFAILPIDFLSHFGYSAQTIFPYTTINHNQSLPRAMSFLRGPNPLGAYLVIITSLAGLWFVKSKMRSQKLMFGGISLLALLALFVSFSRSAWLGALVALALVLWLSLTARRARKIMIIFVVGLFIVFSGTAVALRHSSLLQNYFFHTSDNSTIKISSNEGHASAFVSGVREIASSPLGDGAGTAGPASFYNDRTRIYENYYLMIGVTNGWLGLILFIGFCASVATNLLKKNTKLATALFAALIGLALTNFLLPAWTDVTLAYTFWGLAGVALASKIELNERKANKRTKSATAGKRSSANQKTVRSA